MKINLLNAYLSASGDDLVEYQPQALQRRMIWDDFI